jgi:DNA-binding CsgD family transcriptional regulator/tetratricopeptide (TPR) repeat protein
MGPGVLSTDPVDLDVIGREHELAAIREFVDGPALIPALVLTGPPGIGKTTLWEAAVALAREAGWNILLTRASSAETNLSFAGLADLLDQVGPELLAALPPPQRHALEVALARAEPTGAPPEELAIASGTLGLLRLPELGERVLIAVDDAHWFDAASAAALAFAARRVVGERVRLLLTVRAGEQSTIEREVASRQLELSAIGPLEARRLISQTFGLSVPRPLITRIVETAHGNPLMVLELGRQLIERGTLEFGAELPVPDLARELFGARVRALPQNVGRALLAVSLSAHLSPAELAAMAGPTAVSDATAHGVLALDGQRVRASHPLLAAAALEHAWPVEREAVHLELSTALTDPVRAARHLAIATAVPDAARALAVAQAGGIARRRGAARDAVDLADHALRLTPDDDPERVERILALGEYLLGVGDFDRLQALLEPELERLPDGATRARAHMLLAPPSTSDGHTSHVEQAVQHGKDDPEVLAVALSMKAILFAVMRIERIEDAVAWAEESLAVATAGAPESEARALDALAWARAMRGMPTEGLAPAVEEPGESLYEQSAERIAGVRHGFRGEVEQGREMIERLAALADERGEGLSSEIMMLHLSELAIRAGDCDRARQVLETWETWAALDRVAPARLRCGALLAAMTGDERRAVDLSESAIELSDDAWDTFDCERALGLAALLGGRAQEAAERFAHVWHHMEREGVDELGAFPVAGELAQTLCELGRGDEARAVATRLRALSEAQDHPWGLATAMRSDALIALIETWDDEAEAALHEAAAAYARLDLGFDRARTLLGLGRAQRRHRKWGAARETLSLAAEAFAALGAPGWADVARSEIERVGARRPAGDGKLTIAESRVVALAAEGMSNKEIALALVVTVHTVEVHLSHAYAKLGVKSRSQLPGALASLP